MTMKGVIRLTDPTTGGGTIISASSQMTVDGKPIACVGDFATCPIHRGSIRIVEGSSCDTLFGKAMAYDGCALSCGCKCITTTDRYMIESNRNGETSLPAKAFDQHLIIEDQDGQPLGGIPYLIVGPNGARVMDQTGDEGKTKVIKGFGGQSFKCEIAKQSS